MKNVICIFLFLFLSCSVKKDIIPNDFECKVIGIKDGDTIAVLYNRKSQIIRLAHIDCPEKKQPFGTVAKKFASDLCFGKTVKIINAGKKDRNKRIIATVYIDSICLNEELVKAGLAWHYKQYSVDITYAELETTARQQKIGVWSDTNAVEPWLWRKKKTKL